MEAKLVPGIGFHLMPSGQWSPEEIPETVLEEAKFSGYLTIEGYRSTVFETKDKELWAQKSTGTSALAARVAARYLESARKDDLTSQVQEIFQDEREDTEYDDAIASYCDSSFAALEKLNERVQECLEEFARVAETLGECDHEKVQNVFAAPMQKALMGAAAAVKSAGDEAIVEIVRDLKKLKDDATRRSR